MPDMPSFGDRWRHAVSKADWDMFLRTVWAAPVGALLSLLLGLTDVPRVLAVSVLCAILVFTAQFVVLFLRASRALVIDVVRAEGDRDTARAALDRMQESTEDLFPAEVSAKVSRFWRASYDHPFDSYWVVFRDVNVTNRTNHPLSIGFSLMVNGEICLSHEQRTPIAAHGTYYAAELSFEALLRARGSGGKERAERGTYDNADLKLVVRDSVGGRSLVYEAEPFVPDLGSQA